MFSVMWISKSTRRKPNPSIAMRMSGKWVLTGRRQKDPCRLRAIQLRNDLHTSKSTGGSGGSSGSRGNHSKSKLNQSTSKKPGMSRSEMRKKGICFECGTHGHIAMDCPTKKDSVQSNSIETIPQSNSIWICAVNVRKNPPRKLYSQSRTNSRSYSEVASGKLNAKSDSPNVPTISLSLKNPTDKQLTKRKI